MVVCADEEAALLLQEYRNLSRSYRGPNRLYYRDKQRDQWREVQTVLAAYLL